MTRSTRPSRRRSIYAQGMRAAHRFAWSGVSDYGSEGAQRTLQAIARQTPTYAAGFRNGLARMSAKNIYHESIIGVVRQASGGLSQMLYLRGHQNSGKTVGSFKHRKGQWKKGKGGRFVGTNG